MEFRMNNTDGLEIGIWSYDDICPRTSISELSHQHINHSEPISRSYKASIDTKPKKKNNFHSHAYSMYQKKGPFKRRYCSTQTCYIFLITLWDIKDHAIHNTFGKWLTFFNLDNYLMYLYTLYLYIDSPVSLYFEGNNEWIFVPGLEQDYNKVTSQVA